MSADVSAKMRIGLLRLTDSAPAILAYEFGFFADEGIEVELSVEPSWANIADKLAFGFIDAAVIIPPLAFAVQLGLRGTAEPLIIPVCISGGGNSITLTQRLAQKAEAIAENEKLPHVEALARCLRAEKMTLGVVHTYSTHNLLLRYWLATAGVEAERDYQLAVVPPARAVEALTSGEIAGFCAGAPWGHVAQQAGVGSIIARSYDVWQNAPEKAFAVRSKWADENPAALGGIVRALLRAAKFCDDPQNAFYTASLMSRPEYIAVPEEVLLQALPSEDPAQKSCVFYRGAINFPWRSHGLWFLDQMQRWKLIGTDVDQKKLSGLVYRPDLYRTALAATAEPLPSQDWKPEGAHEAPWALEALTNGSASEITMPADGFCDRSVFGV